MMILIFSIEWHQCHLWQWSTFSIWNIYYGHISENVRAELKMRNNDVCRIWFSISSVANANIDLRDVDLNFEIFKLKIYNLNISKTWELKRKKRKAAFADFDFCRQWILYPGRFFVIFKVIIFCCSNNGCPQQLWLDSHNLPPYVSEFFLLMFVVAVVREWY